MPPFLYLQIRDRIKDLACPAKDVEMFSVALAELEGEKDFYSKAGPFLSALINNSKDREFVIHTTHLAFPIQYIGYHNTKIITLEGDAGDDVGCMMKDGILVVRGDAGCSVGQGMVGGAITIMGKAMDNVGSEICGGRITVEGNAGENVGCYMKGGEIRINGEYASLSKEHEGGKIYHKDSRVWRLAWWL
jgi:glutamate synthase domain-containing protein 3